MIVGIIGVQGNVSEHIESLEKASEELRMKGQIKWIRKVEELENVKALIIPGGESTTISKLIDNAGMFPKIVELAKKGVPIMGTCAGCILLAKEGGESVRQSKTRLLGLMDMTVERNAFGRQFESFETHLQIEGLDTYPAVFIRAPIITKVWNECEVLAMFDEKIVMARQGNLMALAFHPELSDDTRVHKMFLEMIKSKA